MGFETWMGQKVGLVLQGGGGKGAYQIGAFKALREAGLNDLVTAIAGSSVGALNMCLFNYDDGLVGEDIWNNISPEEFVDPEWDMLDGTEGIVKRDGLLRIINDYIDLEKVRSNPLDLFATVTEYVGMAPEKAVNCTFEPTGTPVARYMTLNGKTNEEIKQILLASSSMPIIYEPVVMNGKVYQDGGLMDNLPIKPLHVMGIRKFIVILLNHKGVVPVEEYPDSEFLIVKPSDDLGDLVTGTLDFTAKGARRRMELGYIDAARSIRFFGQNNMYVDDIAQIELRQFNNKLRVESSMDSANSNMGKLNDILNKYL